MAEEKNSSESISWTASEYIDHQRGGFWYLLLLAGTAITGALIYLVTRDYFAPGTIIVLGVIVAMVARWEPRQMNYQLTSKGLHAGEKFYPFSLFKTFSIVREAELSSLVFHPIKRFTPPLSVFFDETEQDRIINVLGHHLPLQPGGVDRVDRISRRLRF